MSTPGGRRSCSPTRLAPAVVSCSLESETTRAEAGIAALAFRWCQAVPRNSRLEGDRADKPLHARERRSVLFYGSARGRLRDVPLPFFSRLSNLPARMRRTVFACLKT